MTKESLVSQPTQRLANGQHVEGFILAETAHLSSSRTPHIPFFTVARFLQDVCTGHFCYREQKINYQSWLESWYSKPWLLPFIFSDHFIAVQRHFKRGFLFFLLRKKPETNDLGLFSISSSRSDFFERLLSGKCQAQPSPAAALLLSRKKLSWAMNSGST